MGYDVNNKSYTSEQYKYMLLLHLQRHFSFPKEFERNYTLAFYKALLDGIELDRDSYLGFIELLDKYMKYCHKDAIDEASDFVSTDLDINKGLLIDAFAKIGIEFNPTMDDNNQAFLYFTKPDGTEMLYEVLDGKNEFQIHAIYGQETEYAHMALPYYQFKNIDPIDLSDFDCRKAGSDCYWNYDPDTTTMTITGTGMYVGAPIEEQVGAGEYTTLIIGPNIDELNSGEATRVASLKTVVLLHAADFPLIVTEFDHTSTSYNRPARNWDIYTDNEVIKNHTFDAKVTISWHSLSEWEG